jgi:hypothetical protein
MSLEDITQRYDLLMGELEKIIVDAESRITGEPADVYFVSNANFFTKSFLISLCCYLEAFLKEIANLHVSNAKQRLKDAKVPHNLLAWAVSREVKDKDLRFDTFSLPLTDKEIDEELSGNPFRTAKCFRYLGIDLDAVTQFVDSKDLINSVVAKRNRVIHHNDTAGDISLGDIKEYCRHFRGYLDAISKAVIAVHVA